MQNIKKYYLRCQHIKAQLIMPEQTSLTISNTHDIFQCQQSNCVKSQLHVKIPAWFNLVQNAHAPSYDTLLLSSEQLTEDMAGTEHFTETR